MKIARRQLEELYFDGLLFLKPTRTYWERREMVKQGRKELKRKVRTSNL